MSEDRDTTPVWVTKFGQEYHASPDCEGIKEGHILAESHNRERHEPTRLSRWIADARGLRAHTCIDR
jgi:hypothetical protein